tara:strand:- start:1789 stop:2163 length:375 start_codon:yes stop_codon:yes gene_type:complete
MEKLENLPRGNYSDNKENWHQIVITKDNVIETSEFIFQTVARKRGEVGSTRLKEDGLTLAELRTFINAELKKIEDDDGVSYLNLPGCKCTNPPSMGFCRWGMCMWGSINIGKDFSATFTITIPF